MGEKLQEPIPPRRDSREAPSTNLENRARLVGMARLRRPRPRISGRNPRARDAIHAPRCAAERGADGASAPSLPKPVIAAVPSPEGTSDNSPAFQRWVKANSAQVPKGRSNRTTCGVTHAPHCASERSASPQLRRSDLFVVTPVQYESSPVGAAYSGKTFSIARANWCLVLEASLELGTWSLELLRLEELL
jgi:hypothetical protein